MSEGAAFLPQDVFALPVPWLRALSCPLIGFKSVHPKPDNPAPTSNVGLRARGYLHQGLGLGFRV